jgi:hypothetical protein
VESVWIASHPKIGGFENHDDGSGERVSLSWASLSFNLQSPSGFECKQTHRIRRVTTVKVSVFVMKIVLLGNGILLGFIELRFLGSKSFYLG